MEINHRSPGLYTQRPGAIWTLGKYICDFGTKALMVCSEGSMQRYGNKLVEYAADADYDIVPCTVTGLTTLAEIDAVTAMYNDSACDLIVGMGGGKILDSARAAADILKCPLIIVPTVASNDAPCSALSVIHDENGAVIELRTTKRNPDVVLVDTEVIISAPERLFTAGLGDALATWFEVRACKQSGVTTLAGSPTSDISYTLAKLCFDTLIKSGRSAMLAVRTGFVNDEFDRTVQASIYLSGIGFESGGVCGAHAINDGFSACEESAHLYHGEIVGFGTLSMLMLEDADQETIDTVTSFMYDVGLPMTFEQMRINPTEDFLRRVSENACSKSVMSNMPFEVTPADVIRAMLKADLIGKNRLAMEKERANEKDQ